MLKILFSETIRWIKLILFMHVYGIILYINYVFVVAVANFFFIFVFTSGRYSDERLKDHWSSGLSIVASSTM